MKRHITRLIDDEGAVSPVIGVILMVAITVILAAVIGTFVLGLGGSTQSAPQASITVQNVDSAGPVTFKHRGSDTITLAELRIKFADADGSSSDVITFSSGAGDFSTADTLTVDPVNNSVTLNGASVSGTSFDTDGITTSPLSGDYTITFIDNPSGQIIAETSITV